MSKIEFEKYQGLGNDFVLFFGESLAHFDPVNPAAIRWICNRKFGIGADGILLAARPVNGGAVRMIYYNSDGSFSETCFNGLRCMALHAVHHHLAKRGEEFIIESSAGKVRALVRTDSDKASTILAGPTFEPDFVPVKASGPVIEQQLNISGMPLIGTALSIGNPHFVVWRGQGDLDLLNNEVGLMGRQVERDPLFPRATNFELACAESPTSVLMAVWERGVGPTLACGSGATATVCAGVKTGRLAAGQPVTVKMAGGSLVIEASADLSQVKVEGGAEFVFSGSFDSALLRQ
jgi:diaminopimelate epimerase